MNGPVVGGSTFIEFCFLASRKKPRTAEPLWMYLEITFLIIPVRNIVGYPGLKPNCNWLLKKTFSYFKRRNLSRTLLRIEESNWMIVLTAWSIFVPFRNGDKDTIPTAIRHITMMQDWREEESKWLWNSWGSKLEMISWHTRTICLVRFQLRNSFYDILFININCIEFRLTQGRLNKSKKRATWRCGMFVQDWTKFRGKGIGNNLSVRIAINNRSTRVLSWVIEVFYIWPERVRLL